MSPMRIAWITRPIAGIPWAKSCLARTRGDVFAMKTITSSFLPECSVLKTALST